MASTCFISWTTSGVAEIPVGIGVVGLLRPVKELPCAAGRLHQAAYAGFCLTRLQTVEELRNHLDGQNNNLLNSVSRLSL